MRIKSRHKILLSFIVASFLLVWFSARPAPSAPLPTNDEIILSGHFGIVHGDDSTFTQESAHAFLYAANQTTELHLSQDITSYISLNGYEVELYGQYLDADPTRDDDAPVFAVNRIQPLEVFDTKPVVQGNERWVNIACRFSDMAEITPQPLDYFNEILANSVPGMDHYWQQTSYSLVNIAGSAAYGWYNLPNDKMHYVRASTVNIGFALRMLLTDCAQAAALSDQVDFSQYSGINIMLNDTFGCCAWGGKMSLNVDGKLVMFRTTWLPPWAFNSLHVIAHEMGHGWGLPHSSGPYGQTYDSAWDVMSGGSRMVDLCRIGSDRFGCHQVGTIGYHLDMLGWLPAERVVTVEPGTSATITLDALTTALSGIDMLLVKVPVDQSTTFYTVEVRSFTGYDRNLPGEAVILHEVVPGRPSPAHVVDGDNNGNPNDEGAMWVAGETFVDRSNQIRVEVLERLGTTFTVRIHNMNQ